jgi:hypothetical protein
LLRIEYGIVVKWYIPGKVINHFPVTTTQISLLNGTLIKSLKVNDTENASDWSIQYNLQEGNTVFGDRAYTFTSVADSVRGAEWIRTQSNVKFKILEEFLHYSSRILYL